MDNKAGQWLDISISQAVVGCNFTKRFGVQFNLPVIHREFSRPEGFAIDRGHESGLGDASLVANGVLFERDYEQFMLCWNAPGGLMFPTGSSSRLAEESDAIDVPGAPESGSHGHDLALGSGSVDGIIGSTAFLRWQRWLVTASLQYNIRTEGDHDYQFANHLAWTVAPGGYLFLNQRHLLALQLAVSGADNRVSRAATDLYVGGPGQRAVGCGFARAVG